MKSVLCDRHQTGAATAIMIILLLVVVSFALTVAMTMAASDATDSAHERDAIEALYLGESGLERATRRLVDGTACTSLAEAAIAFGSRGTFTVIGGYTTDFSGLPLAANRCRIQVRGTVTDSLATRTIEAVVNFTTGTSGGFVVGKNGLARQWNGIAWNPVPTGTTRDLKGVFCNTVNDCWAVGKNGTTLHWDGSTWNTVASGTTEELRGVSCQPVAPFDCFAVGKAGAILRWNGLNWANMASGTNEDLKDISCPSTVCYSVGKNGVIQRYNGTLWSNDPSATNKELKAIACLAATDCWATGKKQGNNFTFVQRTTTWAEVLVPSNKKTDLEGVACIAASDCWAVGKKKDGQFTFLHWNGSAWSYQPVAGSDEDLKDVSCLANGECWAVGKKGKILYLNGTWSNQASGTNEDLESVHIPANGGAATASLLNWREVIS